VLSILCLQYLEQDGGCNHGFVYHINWVTLLPPSDKFLPPSEVKVNLTGQHLCHLLLTFTTSVPTSAQKWCRLLLKSTLRSWKSANQHSRRGHSASSAESCSWTGSQVVSNAPRSSFCGASVQLDWCCHCKSGFHLDALAYMDVKQERRHRKPSATAFWRWSNRIH